MGGDPSTPFTVPVGSFPLGASPFGCLDMAGNVCEWAQDWLGPLPAQAGDDPTGPAEGTNRVHRGSHWTMAYPDAFAATFRSGQTPENHGPQHGFRVCRSPR